MNGLAIVRSVHLAASVLLAGSIVFELLVLRPAADAPQGAVMRQEVRRWLWRLAVAGLVLGWFSWAGWLLQVATEMTGLAASEALSADKLMLVVTRTTFGHVWIVRSALFLLLVLPLLFAPAGTRQPSRWLGWGCAAAAAALLGSLAWTGHAVASTPLHLWVDAAHLVAAGVWFGMLPPLALLVHRACADGGPTWQRLAGRAARLFSAPGTAAVLVLATTGALNSWWLVGSPANLVRTSYGLLLAGKLAAFAAMLALAASNRMVLTPHIERASAQPASASGALRRLRRNVVAEMVLGAAILALVGRLGVTPPALHELAGHDAHQHEGHDPGQHQHRQ
jgi:putative copper resistance protein D